MNVHLYNLTFRHNDVFFYFDINRFIYNFKVIQANVYWPTKCKRQVATLLAYNLQNLDTCMYKSIDYSYVSDRTVSITTNNNFIDCSVNNLN